jgi:geranylgeranyl diphosphate synthase type I
LREALVNPLGLAEGPTVRGGAEWLLLPVLCCLSIKGDSSEACLIAAAWALLYTSAHILDKIEDDEQLPWMKELGTAPSINIASAMIVDAFGMLTALRDHDADEDAVAEITRDFHRTVMKMCAGQHHDLTCSTPSLDECWRMARDKSGQFFALSCRAGARLATSDRSLVHSYGMYGHHLGMMVQIQNDIAGIWLRKGIDNDVCSGERWTLPVAYFMEVGNEQEKRQLLEYLAADIEVDEKVARVTELLERSGARLYLHAKSEGHRNQAAKALASANAGATEMRVLTGFLKQISVSRII